MWPLARFRIEDDSMRPFLAAGDYVIVNRWAYRFRRPDTGHVVVASDPEVEDRFLVKRISHVSPEGLVSLEGDNRERSRDSRSFGPVPTQAIVGRVWLRLRA
jgi:nickel-type superoxide dismutase maturation protease